MEQQFNGCTTNVSTAWLCAAWGWRGSCSQGRIHGAFPGAFPTHVTEAAWPVCLSPTAGPGPLTSTQQALSHSPLPPAIPRLRTQLAIQSFSKMRGIQIELATRFTTRSIGANSLQLAPVAIA